MERGRKEGRKNGEHRVQGPSRTETTVEEFAIGMFTSGAAHIKRWKEKGNILKPQTIEQHCRHLKKYLFPKFGTTPLVKIRPAKVEDFLLEQELANSTRNTIP